MGSEVVCSWPYLSPALTRGYRTRISIPGSRRIRMYTPLMSVQVIRGAESFATDTAKYGATIGFGMSLLVFSDNSRSQQRKLIHMGFSQLETLT